VGVVEDGDLIVNGLVRLGVTGFGEVHLLHADVFRFKCGDGFEEMRSQCDFDHSGNNICPPSTFITKRPLLATQP
jgi:hypothetical protein